MITDRHIHCLIESFKGILGTPSEGTMAFVRCFDAALIGEVIGHPEFRLHGWEVYGVVGDHAPQTPLITADQAVEYRENKQGNILLLVDPQSAGAGMDGIYSAVREIGERELFDAAIRTAKKNLSHDKKSFIDEAVKKGRQVGGTNRLAPRDEFDFYARCLNSPESLGENLVYLGLWPIDLSKSENPSYDLNLSKRVVECLLAGRSARGNVDARTESLLLSPEQEDTRKELDRFLRSVEGLRWTEALLKLPEYSIHGVTSDCA